MALRNQKEYQAIFYSPYGHVGSKGPIVDTLEKAMECRPERAEETHEYLGGFEVREVAPWRAVSVDDILKAKGLK